MKLKLFVWTEVLCDYSCGVMFALAPDVETARKLILASRDWMDEDELKQEPDVYTEPVGFAVAGGG